MELEFGFQQGVTKDTQGLCCQTCVEINKN